MESEATLILRFDLFGADRALEAEINCRENTAIDREQVRDKGEIVEIPAELLAYLRRVPMRNRAVGPEVFRDFGEEDIDARAAPRSRDPGFGIAKDVRTRFHEPGRYQGEERKKNGRRVASRVGNESGAGDRPGIPFRQAIDRLAQNFGRVVAESVPGGVAGRIFQAKGSAVIDDPAASSQYRGRELMRDLVGSAEKYRIRMVPCETIDV